MRIINFIYSLCCFIYIVTIVIDISIIINATIYITIIIMNIILLCFCL